MHVFMKYVAIRHIDQNGVSTKKNKNEENRV
jgi:hypothetical protein